MIITSHISKRVSWMSQKFNELKRQVQNIDKDKVGQLVKEIKQAFEDGKINENERNELISTAKQSFSDIDLGGLGGFGKKE